MVAMADKDPMVILVRCGDKEAKVENEEEKVEK